MILRLGYDIQFEIVPASVPMVALLNVHPSRIADLRAPDELLRGACGEDGQLY